MIGTVVDDVRCVPVIIGPTAAGKTAVAGALARVWNVTVISADSRQIYRTLDIGTAKPDVATRKRVPHYGLDLVDPGERFSAGQFARVVPQWLEDISDDHQVLVVGGTGFYIKAVTDGLFEEPEIDESKREQLRAWAYGNCDVERWATRLDANLDVVGQQRASRAVEVALLTGYPLSWWHRQSPGPQLIHPQFFRLRLPREVLYDRIRTRVHEMMDRGWIAEVERVLGSGIPPTAHGLDAVGYREIVLHLAGDLPRRELPDRIAQSTRRYAKRQETWFNHQLGNHPVVTLDATESIGRLADQIVDVWTERP